MVNGNRVLSSSTRTSTSTGTGTGTGTGTRKVHMISEHEHQPQQPRKKIRIKLTLRSHYASMEKSNSGDHDHTNHHHNHHHHHRGHHHGHPHHIHGTGTGAGTGAGTRSNTMNIDVVRGGRQEENLMLRPSCIVFQEPSPSHERIEMIDKLHAMRRQEADYHPCHDYIRKPIGLNDPNRLMPPLDLIFSSNSSSSKLVDEACRFKIVAWCYRIIDFFGLDRETAYFAISYLERFMAIHHLDRNNYKLAATTALLLAIKIHQPKKVSLNKVVKDLSRGQFDEKDVVSMELIMLRSLTWRIHPPTPAQFVMRILALNPFSSRLIQEFDTERIQSLAIFYVELSICDYFFVTQKQSNVALAAILNAMESLGLFRSRMRGKSSSLFKFIDVMFDTMGGNHDSPVIIKCRRNLQALYKRSDEYVNKRKMEIARRLDRSVNVASICRSRTITDDDEMKNTNCNNRYKIASMKSQSPKSFV